MNNLTLSTERFTKNVIKTEADNIVNNVVNGENDPLQVYFYLKALEEMIKTIKDNKEFDSAVKNEILKYSEKDSEVFGVKFQTVTRRSFTYNNQELKELEAKKAGIDAQIKAMQKYMQNLDEPTINSDTGELIYPAEVTTSEYIKTTFAKE